MMPTEIHEDILATIEECVVPYDVVVKPTCRWSSYIENDKSKH